MNETKPTLSSKTVLTNLALAVINVLVLVGILSVDLGSTLSSGLAAGGGIAAINTVGNLVAAWFRKKATAKLV